MAESFVDDLKNTRIPDPVPLPLLSKQVEREEQINELNNYVRYNTIHIKSELKDHFSNIHNTFEQLLNVRLFNDWKELFLRSSTKQRLHNWKRSGTFKDFVNKDVHRMKTLESKSNVAELMEADKKRKMLPEEADEELYNLIEYEEEHRQFKKPKRNTPAENEDMSQDPHTMIHRLEKEHQMDFMETMSQPLLTSVIKKLSDDPEEAHVFALYQKNSKVINESLKQNSALTLGFDQRYLFQVIALHLFFTCLNRYVEHVEHILETNSISKLQFVRQRFTFATYENPNVNELKQKYVELMNDLKEKLQEYKKWVAQKVHRMHKDEYVAAYTGTKEMVEENKDDVHPRLRMFKEVDLGDYAGFSGFFTSSWNPPEEICEKLIQIIRTAIESQGGSILNPGHFEPEDSRHSDDEEEEEKEEEEEEEKEKEEEEKEKQSKQNVPIEMTKNKDDGDNGDDDNDDYDDEEENIQAALQEDISLGKDLEPKTVFSSWLREAHIATQQFLKAHHNKRSLLAAFYNYVNLKGGSHWPKFLRSFNWRMLENESFFYFDTPNSWLYYIYCIISAFEMPDIPRTQGYKLVFRGLHNTSLLQNQSKVLDLSMLSTSLSATAAQSFTDINSPINVGPLLVIILPPGTPYMCMTSFFDDNELSSEEFEILLPPGNVLEVVDHLTWNNDKTHKPYHVYVMMLSQYNLFQDDRLHDLKMMLKRASGQITEPVSDVAHNMLRQIHETGTRFGAKMRQRHRRRQKRVV